MKNWKTPEVNELDISITSYSTNPGTRQDGAYTSKDGKYSIPTYGPSGGNDGTPAVTVSEDGVPGVGVN